MEFSEKKYVIFAGANGSGKSTLYNLHPEYQSMLRINVDELIKKYGNWNDISAQIEAGKQAAALLCQYLRAEKSFNQETTLCGRSILKNIEIAKNNRFEIEIHYIGVQSAKICKDRIKHRVEIGGHGIPDADVDRRYEESLKNIQKIFDICDRIFFYDNTKEISLLAIYENKEWNFIGHDIPDWFKKILLTQQGSPHQCY